MCISDLQIYNRHYGQRVAYLIRHCILFLRYRNRFFGFYFYLEHCSSPFKKKIKQNLMPLKNIKTEQDC